jgi:hypothetical protein
MTNLEQFPAAYREHSFSDMLAQTIDSVVNHSALKMETEDTCTNIVKAGLAFTSCFYGNLVGALCGYLQREQCSPLTVEHNTEVLHLLLDLASGELATKNIPTRAGNYSPHYVAMLEAAQEAGVNTEPFEQFQRDLATGLWVKAASRNNGFCPELTAYLSKSDYCAKRPELALATIALRELTLSSGFSVLLEHLPVDQKYDKLRNFYQAHIELDEGEHGPLMAKALSSVTDIGKSMSVMIDFYELRKAVYDACLTQPCLW